MHCFIYALQSAFDDGVILIVGCCRTSINIKKCIILKSVCLHFPHLCIQCNNCSAYLKWPCRLWDWLTGTPVDADWRTLISLLSADVLNELTSSIWCTHWWLPVTRIASVQPSSLFEKRVSPRRAGHPYGGRKKKEKHHPSAVRCPDLT